MSPTAMTIDSIGFLTATALLVGTLGLAAESAKSGRFVDGALESTITAVEHEGLRTYTLTTNAELRDKSPHDRNVTFSEQANHARLRTGNMMFDGLHALAVHEAVQNSVSEIRDAAYGNGEATPLEAFQTGELWTYVWTRDIAYSTHLALASFDPERALNSLLFKTSRLKESVSGGLANQIIQDTGSGGSYPVSTDRIVWILGISEVLKFLPEPRRTQVLKECYAILRDTIEHDRRVIYDPEDGLYRGEQSFLDWREQTYPGWTKDNVLAIATSKSLSVNVAYCFALQTAADYAARLGQNEERNRYSSWAKALMEDVNSQFYDSETGHYSTCLLADPSHPVRTHRYDLLGESLAVLLGVANDRQASALLENYPCGSHGPPVVWPQERSVPIYHNQAIWPFVTSYWLKAGRQAGSVDAVDRGVRSLVRGAALNLSNMENLDLVTGRAEVNEGEMRGPVINSRRQLWSVAGYLSMVQDVLFGMETSWDGIRFRPFVSNALRREWFPESQSLELDGFLYQGKRIHVRIHLPPSGTKGNGPCRIAATRINGKAIDGNFISPTSLAENSVWDIDLAAPSANSSIGPVVPSIPSTTPDSIYGPHQPQWATAISPVDGKLTLRFSDRSNDSNFNIYRDGILCAKGLSGNSWVDRDSGDLESIARFYTVEAIDRRSGNASHLAPAATHPTSGNQWIIPAATMKNEGGILTDGRYFRDWGRSNHSLTVTQLTVPHSGSYLLRAEFSNGSGPVNTGITCAVKKIELRTANEDRPVAQGYLVMPQSGDWKRFDQSSPIRARLVAGVPYTLRISEDEFSRNMSYFKNNRRYTSKPGGGTEPFNFVNIASVQLTRIAESPALTGK